MKEKGIVLLVILILSASITVLALKIVENRRRIAGLELRNIERKEAILLYQSIKKVALKEFYSDKTFPRTYILRTFKAEVWLSKEKERLNILQASREEISDLFLELGLSQQQVDQFINKLESLRQTSKLLESFADILRLGVLDDYHFWFSPGIYRKITIYPSNFLRLEVLLQYEGRRYHIFSILNSEGKEVYVVWL